jgi:hypothetical protein
MEPPRTTPRFHFPPARGERRKHLTASATFFHDLRGRVGCAGSVYTKPGVGDEASIMVEAGV